jgi:hypothetical protein
MTTADQIAVEKDRLPRGWGRYGKAIDELATITDTDEQLLATCVTLNPTFQHRSITLAGGILEATDATNVVIAATDRRVVVVQTGMSGGPRGNYDIPYAELEIVDEGKKEFTLRWSAGDARFRGAAKSMVGPLLDVLKAQIARHHG